MYNYLNVVFTCWLKPSKISWISQAPNLLAAWNSSSRDSCLLSHLLQSLCSDITLLISKVIPEPQFKIAAPCLQPHPPSPLSHSSSSHILRILFTLSLFECKSHESTDFLFFFGLFTDKFPYRIEWWLTHRCAQ